MQNLLSWLGSKYEVLNQVLIFALSGDLLILWYAGLSWLEAHTCAQTHTYMHTICCLEILF